MKKVILTMCVAGTLLATSCKKAKEEVKDAKETTVEAVEKASDKATEAATKVVEGTEAVVEKATEAVKSAIEGISIPEFKDAKVTEHLKNYASYANDYIAAKGDVLKNASLAKKGVELAAKGKELVASLDAEGVKKYNGVMNAIMSKMAPAK